MEYVARLGALYQATPALWRSDDEPQGFEWVDVNDRANSVLSYLRRTDDSHALVVLNLTPTAHPRYRIGVPDSGDYVLALSTDDTRWGGSGYAAFECVTAEDVPYHGRHHSVELALPPLSALVLVPAPLKSDVAASDDESEQQEEASVPAFDPVVEEAIVAVPVPYLA